MKPPRFFWTSSAVCLMLASCDKTKPSAAAPADSGAADELAAERAALEDERLALERQRLEEERAALEEEKEALRAEREARLASREAEANAVDGFLEERQRELDERDALLGDREGDLARREANLSDQELELAGRESLDDWEPDPEPEVNEPVADYGTFYDDLQSYGSWYETPDYGYVYQPTVVVQDSSWRPYTRGRWACTNLGWNWVSDEPFGWACFHYGRWALLAGRGWVWVPGDEWAPSWVCWREGGEHVGWAPLPPETLCYRGRGWSSSVEADFGIGSSCFSFVHRRHMADHLWRHCLPLEQNRHCIQQTANITNIKFHRDRIVCGGPRYDRLRHEVGKPWPVYQIETDRFKAIRDLNRRNANFRGNQLAVFAPNLGAQWNGQLRPSRLAGKWDEVNVVRAESGIKPEWTERFREAREKQKAKGETKEGSDRAVAAKVLEANRSKVAAAQEKLQAKQQEQTEARRAKRMIQREEEKNKERESPGGVAGRADREARPGDSASAKPTLAERQRQAVERLREARSQRNPEAPAPARERAARGGGGGGARPPAGRGDGSGKQPEVTRERPGMVREPAASAQPGQARRNPALPEGVTRRGERTEQPARGPDQAEQAPGQTARREQMEEARQQQQEQARQRQEQAKNDAENRRQQMEENRQRQEQARGVEEDGTRRERMEEARRQQQEAAREKEEQARQQQQQMEEARRSQQEEARARQEQARQEQARREAEESNRRQQQEEMRRQQQEQARQEREEQARRQQEEQARQQERMREQQEERAQRQEEARREQEERARQQQEERARQQEERARQQEEARREAQERARQQQEEQERRQEERAREQQEKQQERQRGR